MLLSGKSERCKSVAAQSVAVSAADCYAKRPRHGGGPADDARGRRRNCFGRGLGHMGREGIVGPLMSTDAVVDVFAMDRGLFDAANAATRHKTIATNTPRLASRSSRSPARRTT